MRLLLLLLLLAPGPALAQAPGGIEIVARQAVALEPQPADATLGLHLTLAYFREGGWTAAEIGAAVNESARILSQCGTTLKSAVMLLVEAPERYRYFHTPRSRELARTLMLPRPAVFFVLGTRQRPAFDAEAIGRGNSGPRPELTDTVWIARGARNPGVALAHELAHVLMDSGEHSDEPGNLMRDETAPDSIRLTAAQCVRLRATGSANGLLR